MAEIDASIPLQVKQPQQQDPLDQIQKMYALKDTILRDKSIEAEQQKQAGLKDIFANADFSTDQGRADAINKMMKVDPVTAMDVQGKYLDQDKVKAQTKESLAGVDEKTFNTLKAKQDFINDNVESIWELQQKSTQAASTQWPIIYAKLQQSPLLSDQEKKGIPQKYDPNYVNSMATQSKLHKDAVDEAEKIRHDRSQEGIESFRASTESRQGQERIGIERERLKGEGQQVVSDKDQFGNVNYGIIDKKTGAFRQVTDPQGNAVQVGGKPGAAGAAGGGGREGVMNQRILNSANQAVQDIKNLARLPATTDTGVFGSYEPGHGLAGVTKSVLARKVTSQDAQDYQVRSAGLSRSLATMESNGLAPPGSLTSGLEKATTVNPGDSVKTKYEKMAEVRQIVEANIESQLANPRLSEDQKKLLGDVRDQVKQAIPYTIEDIDSVSGGSKESLGSGKEGVTKGGKNRPSLDSFGPGGSTIGGAGQRPSLDSFGG
jgi:hypothetical protein